MIVYFINFLTFPNNMFGEPILEDLSRGMLRIHIPLFQIIMFLYFYSIGKWHLEKSSIWLLASAGLFFCSVLSLTRQIILIMSIIGFFQLLKNVSWVRKFIIGASLAMIALVAYTQLPIFQTMQELSENQIDATTSQQKEDVRISDWRYFGYEGTDNIVPLLFGNGTPSATNSVWGRQLDAFMEENGWFMADTSWPACLYQYGYVTTAILLTILFSAIVKRKTPTKGYLTYFFIALFLRGIASGIWYYPDEIIVSILGFYFLYAKDSTDMIPNRETQCDSILLTYPRKFITKI